MRRERVGWLRRFGILVSASLAIGVPVAVALLVGRPEWQFSSGVALAAAVLFATGVWLLQRRALQQRWQTVSAAVGADPRALGGETLAAVSDLQQQSFAASRQRQRLDSVLGALPQGIIVVDAAGVIQIANPVTATLLGGNGLVTRHIAAVIKSPVLTQLIEATLRQQVGHEVDVAEEGDERILLAQAAPCAWGESRAALVVLTDVTRVRRLEHMRRDFVANVSHELRTPITAINGFVETILDNHMYETEEAGRFLEIAKRQAQRMAAIIGDLLLLTSLEVGEERADVVLEQAALAPALQAAAQVCFGAASDRDVSIGISCESDLTCRMNAQLVEQALINLLQNAIKYAQVGSTVGLAGTRADRGITIAVHDDGIGIASEHHERIFERFYRVERARGGDQLGTGLGLAIVKHIALLHDGAVTVASSPGQGSTFSLLLPN
jgi:two-component system phosphate regulon sensor histidine kinase PhoR